MGLQSEMKEEGTTSCLWMFSDAMGLSQNRRASNKIKTKHSNYKYKTIVSQLLIIYVRIAIESR